jgi:phospholipase C
LGVFECDCHGRAAHRRTGDIHEIPHVIVIVEENRSFDSFFGTYPHADGIPMRHGKPALYVPEAPASRPAPLHPR